MSFLRFPLGAVLAVLYVYFLVAIYATRKKNGLYDIMAGPKACIATTIIALAAVVVCGFSLLPVNGVFALVMLPFITSTGLAAIGSVHGLWKSLRSSSAPAYWSLPSRLSHICFFLLMAVLLFGSADCRKETFAAPVDTPVMADGMPFALVVRDFYKEAYPPMSFVSEIELMDMDALSPAIVRVNHPVRHSGWWIYQSGCDDAGSSVLMAVKDPWYPVAVAALWGMLLAGVALLVFGLFRRGKHGGEYSLHTALRISLVVLAAAYAVFVCLNFILPNFFGGDRVAVLHSPWFAPHIVSYMGAYAMLGIALILGICAYLSQGRAGVGDSDRLQTLCDSFVRIGFGLLALGLCMGALWAKTAWGEWWSWDPKETWALATFIGYLLYLHLRRFFPRENFYSVVVLALSFLLLQMCWYGVNYLPSASSSSLHIY